MTDFSVPQRMGFGAFVIYFLKFFRLTFNASIIYMAYTLFQSDGDLTKTILKIAAIVGCTTIFALILASLAIFQMKFHVEDGNLIYRHNLISRATTTIPLSRIHTLRTRQGLLYRLFDLRGVLFDTLAAKEEEIELVLSESDWQSLLTRIERQELTQSAVSNMSPAYNPSSFIEFSNKDLVFDALCQNHLKGMVVLGGFVSVIFNTLSDFSENSIELIEGYIKSHFDQFALSVTGVALIMACTYIVSLVLWLGKVLLRYYNLSLTYNSKMLTFSHGLFSRLSSRFTRDKICTVWIKRNYFEKRFGLSTIALRQALNSSAKKEDDNLKIYGRDHYDFFLSWWLGQDYGQEADIATAKSGKGVISRSLLSDVLLSSVAIAVLWHFGLYVWTILPATYLLAGIPKGILTMRHSHITLKESYLIVNNGCFAETKNYLKYDNIEVVRVTRTPLSRFTGRVSLSISTTGTTFTVRSLRQEQAMNIYELLLAKPQK
ncbi:PH domain-containing protein [uncultured Duncaniella sp.]|uniref:PH domain-containing protein n=1 Tax=uncultured Duncaniella sp. TaxID=2768039 RepID=UPI0025B2CF08|nr:PH domain-containing protein [uncultured Duncaniella sp.]